MDTIRGLVILICIIYPKACVSQPCKESWINHEGLCYYFSEINRTREGAREYCRDLNATLVGVTNTEINDFLFENRNHSAYYLIGLVPFDSAAQNAVWGWNDGTVANNLGWGSTGGTHEPTGSDACATIKTPSYKLFDEPCFFRYSSICEKESQPIDQGWHFFDHHWYRFISTPLTNMEAAGLCFDKSAYLARVADDVEMDFIKNLTHSRSKDDIWIGLTPLMWDDGSGYQWHNWKSTTGPPDSIEFPNGPAICVAFDEHENKWANVDCESKYYFICAQETISATTTSPSTYSLTTPDKSTQSRYTLTRPNSNNTQPVSPVYTTDNVGNTTSVNEDNADELLRYIFGAVYGLVIVFFFTDIVLGVIYLKMKRAAESSVCNVERGTIDSPQ